MTTNTVQLFLCLLSYGAGGTREPAAERVDLIEINHFHDDQGRHVFDQILFYNWSAEDRRYQVHDWRLLKNPHQIPLRVAREGGYVSVWTDFKSRDQIRRTEATLLRESWTQYDPEVVERDFLPEGRRRKLRDLSPPAALPSGQSTAAAARTATHVERIVPLQNPDRR